jgi:hypothetical protein
MRTSRLPPRPTGRRGVTGFAEASDAEPTQQFCGIFYSTSQLVRMIEKDMGYLAALGGTKLKFYPIPNVVHSCLTARNIRIIGRGRVMFFEMILGKETCQRVA